MEFDVESVVALAMFAKPITNKQTTKMFRAIPENWSTYLQGEPDFFPHGSNLPVEIPIPLMQFKNEDSTIVLLISRQRVEIAFSQRPSQSLCVETSMNFARDRLSEFWDSLVENEIEVDRFAAVVRRLSATEFLPKMLVEKFCTETAAEGPFRRPEAFEIHAHKVFKTSFGPLNSWVRNRTAVRLDNNLQVVTIEQDMNSVQAEGTKTKEDMLSFFNNIASELDKCFLIYYPKGA